MKIKSIIALALLCTTTTAVAASSAQSTTQGKWIQTADGIRQLAIDRSQQQVAASDQATIEVKYVLDIDPQQYAIDSNFAPFAINATTYVGTSQWTRSADGKQLTTTMQIPAGQYDFVAQLKHLDNGHVNGSDHSAWLIRENVDVNQPMTVTASSSEITHHISFVSVNPDGATTVQDCGRFVDSDYTYEIAQPGNARAIEVHNVLNHSRYGMLNYLLGTVTCREATTAVPTRSDGVKTLDVYTNPVSDSYEFKQVRLIRSKSDSIYVVALHQYGSHSADDVATNDASTYFKADLLPVASPMMAELDPENYTVNYSLYIGATLPGGEVPGAYSGMILDEIPENLFVCSGVNTSEVPMALLKYARSLNDLNSSRAYSDATPWIYLCDAEHSHFSAFVQDRYTLGLNGQSYGQWYPGHPGLAVELQDAVHPFETAPFALMSYTEMLWDTNTGRDAMFFAYNPYGQMHELRYTDKLTAQVTIHYNGEEVLQGQDLDYEFPATWAEQEHEPGQYVFTVTNTNYTVDGIPARNVATSTLDNSREDHFPPAIQGFQIRDTEGRLSHHFKTADEGELRIVGADFNAVKQPSEWGYDLWYQADPATLTVEYAPHESNDFKPLEGIEQQSVTYWGFGQFWTVSMADLVASQADQWYDLRVTLTDPSGNTQMQLFSPAFTIEQSTAIDRVHASETSQTGLWYDLQGRSYNQRPQQPGIYVHQGKKVIVR